MDLIEHLEKEHAELRALLKSAEHMLGEPMGVGLDDRLSVDKRLLFEALESFLRAFENHEEVETRLIQRLLRLENIFSDRSAAPSSEMSSKLHQSVSEGHRSLKSITHILGAVASSYDLDQIYSVRHILSSLRHELNEHLDYEEHEVFPKLKEALSPKMLKKMAIWAKKQILDRPTSNRQVSK